MIDKTYKRKIFNRAASSYEKYSHIQDKISQNLLEKFLKKKGNKILNTLNYSKLEFFQADLSEKQEIKNLNEKI